MFITDREICDFQFDRGNGIGPGTSMEENQIWRWCVTKTASDCMSKAS
jgi:hypothetical protein